MKARSFFQNQLDSNFYIQQLDSITEQFYKQHQKERIFCDIKFTDFISNEESSGHYKKSQTNQSKESNVFTCSVIKNFLFFYRKSTKNNNSHNLPTFYLNYEFSSIQVIKSKDNPNRINLQDPHIHTTYKHPSQCNTVNLRTHEDSSNLFLNMIKQYTTRRFDCNQIIYEYQIGQGLTSNVYKVHKSSKKLQPFALKVIDKIKLDIELHSSIVNEIRILRALKNCLGVNKLLNVYECSQNIYLMFEYCNGGNLKSFLTRKRRLQEPDIKIILAQILLSLDYLHQRNINHRDIKLDNILMGKGAYDQPIQKTEIQLADFGFSMNLDAMSGNFETSQLICGTAGYFAPEVMNKGELNLKSDIFSTGCILFNLITGRQLFEGQNRNELMRNNKYCILPKTFLSDIQNCSADLQFLIRCMLNPDPSKRPSASQALKHRLFKEYKEGIHESLLYNQQQQTSSTQFGFDKKLVKNSSNTSKICHDGTVENISSNKIKEVIVLVIKKKDSWNFKRIIIMPKLVGNQVQQTKQDYSNIQSTNQNNLIKREECNMSREFERDIKNVKITRLEEESLEDCNVSSFERTEVEQNNQNLRLSSYYCKHQYDMELENVMTSLNQPKQARLFISEKKPQDQQIASACTK
eukprot:403349613